jgi:Tfp pilus assembly protein FimV
VADTRMTLRQAATVLGVSESALRKRVERGTLRSDKGPDGRRYVYLDTVAYTMADEVADVSATHERDALMSELRAHNDTLQEQLKAERQGHAEARRLLAAALERIPPQLEAPSEARESDVRPGPTGELGELREELGTERSRREMAEATLHEGMAEEQHRREEAERERDELRRELYALKTPESPEPGEEQQGRGEPHPATGEAQEGVQRPWWRRIFRG